MKVTTVLIQPPSLVSQLEGRNIEALTKRVKESSQKVQIEKSNNDNENQLNVDDESQHLIDLMV